MSGESEKIQTAIQELRQRFIDNPADFTVEKTFQTDLRDHLLESLQPSRGEVTATNVNRVREPRVRRTLEKAHSLRRVIEEAQFVDEGIDGAIDLAVLEPEFEFHMEPAKKFQADDARAVIELKFLKTAASIYEAKEDDLRSQIRRLNTFPSDVDKYFAVFAVKDVFEDQQNLLGALQEDLDGEFLYQPTPLPGE